MAGHWTDLFSFVTGAIRQKEIAYLLLSTDEASSLKIPLTGIVQWKPDAWADGGEVEWLAAGTAIARQPLEQLCVVGEFGKVLMIGSGDRHEERIGKGKTAPENRGPLRGVRAIGDHVYCVGMSRQAWRRDAVDLWTEVDNGFPPITEDEIVGFEAVDGFSETDIYACGWDGEIWHYDGSAWSRKDSPVNTVLVDICCAGDGNVYACGRNGLLIRGNGNQWEVVDLAGFSDDIWSLAWFNRRLFVATFEYLLTLGKNGLDVLDMGDDPARTCYDLVTGAGMLWSIGAKDVMSFDGTTWSRID
ncbi:hypothetical protein WN982_37475 [Paraburkholderia sp. IMGN_8]|uniref:hypothetical protein n=1 Tax=Paraburkholderia sp. IMGN_8 TaxID=3136564 RepID=UPI00310106CD